ncbi:MAG: hypothetical protein DRP01_09440 [Archaeoglobales archaeon]|nr:MAG: hypothetical protein DRP01_09440 [Archaeoglobales archaeon]
MKQHERGYLVCTDLFGEFVPLCPICYNRAIIKDAYGRHLAHWKCVSGGLGHYWLWRMTKPEKSPCDMGLSNMPYLPEKAHSDV